MKTIHKYPLEITGEQQIDMPEDSRILSVQVQDGKVCLWAMVDTETEKVKRNVRIFGTGSPVDLDGLSYIGTVQQNYLVWHVFIHIDF